VLDPRRHVDLAGDRIELDGVAVAQAPRACLAMHKPAGIVTTRIDARGRATVYDLLPPELRTLWPIGRLDKQTSGLLLWTNDWRFGDGIRDPANRTEKEYRVRLDRPLAPAHAERLAAPLELRDGTRLEPALVGADPDAPGDPAALTLTLVEGKKRQIRRSCTQLGYEVLRLHRVRIGAVLLGTLAPGGHRELTCAECASFDR
jgi:23S rRNA pseudouridine2605 synthase